MKTKTTHIQRVRTDFASNLQFIRSIGITEQEYYNMILEIGCKFLEERYPYNKAEYYKWYQEFAFSKSFWQWWKLEWNNWMLRMRDSKKIQPSNVWGIMELLPHRLSTQKSFEEQFLKLNYTTQW